MKLYDCHIAPNPRRVRMFAAEKRLEIPTVEVDIVGGENLQPAFLAVNPRGLLPVLELDDGTRIDETVAICRYLEERHPEPPLLGVDALDKALVEARQRHVEFDGMLSASEVFRNSVAGFERRGLPGSTETIPAIPELVERGTASLRRFYGRLNGYLAESAFVAGERFTIADITALCVADFAAQVKLPIPEEHVHTRALARGRVEASQRSGVGKRPQRSSGRGR